MSGGGGPSQTTVTQSNIPDWLRPQVETVLGGATKELFKTKEIPGAIDPETGKAGPSTYEIVGTKPFTPYSTRMEDYVAGFSPLQQQVQANVANLQVPGQFNQATGLAGMAGMGGMQSAQQALGYGQAGFQSGQTGADIGLMGLQAQDYGRRVSGIAEDYAAQAARAGKDYGYLMRTPSQFTQYMSPYQQAVTDLQVQAAQRQADIARTQRSSQAARAGAFGGARQAIENAEADRALQSQLANIQAQGLQSAYDKAQQAIQAGMGYELQGIGTAQQGLGTALQGGQLGLSGIGQAMQGQQLGMQGAGLGLQGVTGAQAGYGLGNQVAANLGQLGTQQLAAQQGILGLQNQIGQQQQQQEQAKINQAIQNYAQAQEAPVNALNQYNALLRGYAVPGQTATSYQAAPSIASQAAGLGLAGVGLSNLAKKKGGKIDSGEGIDKIALRKALAGA
jgi:hypothetical protein